MNEEARPKPGPEYTVAAAKQVIGRLAADRTPCRPLARRAHAARRLVDGDPWTADQADWRDRWDLLMARLGLAPEWQRQRALDAWERGVR